MHKKQIRVNIAGEDYHEDRLVSQHGPLVQLCPYAVGDVLRRLPLGHGPVGGGVVRGQPHIARLQHGVIAVDGQGPGPLVQLPRWP